MKIGLLSDTHGYIDERLFNHFATCDEVWHAGDWGSLDAVNKLLDFKPLRAVWGNIDGYEIRRIFPQHNHFELEGMKIWLTHIGGYPGKYAPEVRPDIFITPPDIFVCGHSHILKVQYDKTLKLLHINPGAAGKYGFHQVQTIIRFDLIDRKIDNLEVVELAHR